MTKKFTEYVVIRDYGKQGLALFDMTSAANRGNVNCWSTLMDYRNEPKGFRPGPDAPMCFTEASMGYYWQGRLVRPNSNKWRELGVDVFIERYKEWALQGYSHHDGDVELEIKVMQRDHDKFQKERWTR